MKNKPTNLAVTYCLQLLLALLASSNPKAMAQSADAIRLIVRADDIGLNHTSNMACLSTLKKGIATSTEIMVPTPWYMEAVKFLQENPTIDVGIHLVLTNEWTYYNWRPLTHAPSLVNENGYFYPTIWKGKPDFQSLNDHKPDSQEVEQELRAQIETARRHLPRISHLSTHMAFDRSNKDFERIVQKLAAEYHLPIVGGPQVVSFPTSDAMKTNDPNAREKGFIQQLAKLEKGKTYLLVMHPGANTSEMETIFTPEYNDVGADRAADTHVLTSPTVKKTLEKYGVTLISVGQFLGKK